MFFHSFRCAAWISHRLTKPFSWSVLWLVSLWAASSVPIMAAEPEPANRDPKAPKLLSRIGAAQFAHADEMVSIAFSPDSKLLASVNKHGTVRLWQLPGGELRFSKFQYPVGVNAFLAFSPDGKSLVLAVPTRIRAWQVATGEEILTLKFRSGVVGLGFSAAGNELSLSNMDGVVSRWEFPSGKEVSRTELPAQDSVRNAAAYTPAQGGLLALGRQDNRLVIYQPGNEQELHRLEDYPLRISSSTRPLVFSPDGKLLAAACRSVSREPRGSWVRLLDVQAGKQIGQLTEDAEALAFSPDSKRLATVTRKGSATVWDMPQCRVRYSFLLAGVQPQVTCVALSPDGKFLAAGVHRRVQLWDLENERELTAKFGPLENLRAMTFLPDSKTLVTATADSMLTLWDARSGKEVNRLHRPREDNHRYGMALAPGGQLLASAARIGMIRLWEVPSGRELSQIEQVPYYQIDALALSPNAKILAWDGGNTQFFETATGRSLSIFPGYLSHFAFAFSPDGKLFASTSPMHQVRWKGQVRLWDVYKGREIGKLDEPVDWLQGANSLVFSPSGNFLAAGKEDRTIRIWDVKTGRELQKIKAHEAQRRIVVQYSPDGKTLVWGTSNSLRSGLDQIIHFCDAETGKEFAQLQAQEDGVAFLAFSPDSTLFAAGGVDNTVLVWDVTSLRQQE